MLMVKNLYIYPVHDTIYNVYKINTKNNCGMYLDRVKDFTSLILQISSIY